MVTLRSGRSQVGPQVGPEGVRGRWARQVGPGPSPLRGGTYLTHHREEKSPSGSEGWISPDCAAGKCTACTGDAWDNDHDRLTPCRHHCHNPQGDPP